MSDEPFLMLSRAYFDHALWTEPRVYSRAEAWLDCVRLAAWRTHRRLVGGIMVEIPRGGIVASERFLSNRWTWSRTKVRDFIDLMDKEGMINRKKDQGIGLISLCNYDKYNEKRTTKKTRKRPGRDQEGTKVEEDIEEEEGTGTPRGRDEIEDGHPPGWEPPLPMFVAECARYLIPAWYAERKWEIQSAKGWAIGKTPALWKKLLPMMKRDFVNDGSPMTDGGGAPRQAGSTEPKPLVYVGKSDI